MSTPWQNITERLRDELQEYGALLSLFEEQQANLLRRDATAVLSLAASIEDQVKTTQSCRDAREQALRAFAQAHRQADNASLRQMLPHFPGEVQPLIQALMDEINHLIHRIRRGARQNQQLLSRTVEAHEQAVRTLRPDLFPKTYSRGGALASVGSTPAWQAAG